MIQRKAMLPTMNSGIRLDRFTWNTFTLFCLIGALQLNQFPTVLTAAEPKPDQQQADKRPPEVDVIHSIESPGGYGLELHRITIRGTARNSAGEPVKNATIYIANKARRVPKSINLLRGQTQTDESGRYELKDIQLIVSRHKYNTNQRLGEGEFSVFGTCDGYGFTWHSTRKYRPDVRPQGRVPGDRNPQVTANAFYKSDPIVIDLIFDHPAYLTGRVTDKQGQPLANTKVQLGLITIGKSSDNGSWSCHFLGNKSQPVSQPVRFDCIRQLPSEFRETQTNAQGYYEFTKLRRDTNYSAYIDPGLNFTPQFMTLATANKNQLKFISTAAIGYNGVLDHEFEAPRNVTIHVAQEKTDRSVANVLITATPETHQQWTGLQTKSDGQGNARLQLLPGKYKLSAEPAPGHPFSFQSVPFSVSEKTGETLQTIKLKPAAIVILKAVNAETGEPISGIRFNYKMGENGAQFPVSTQTVYLDYPQTNSAGEIQAFMSPGMCQFEVAAGFSPTLPANNPSKTIQLTAGKLTTVEFQLTPSQFLSSQPDSGDFQPNPDSIFPPDLQLKWHKQSQLLDRSSLQVTTNTTFANHRLIDIQGFLKDLRSLDPLKVPDITTLLIKYQTDDLYWNKQLLTSDGNTLRADRFDRFKAQNANQLKQDILSLPQRISLYDGKYLINHYVKTKQVSASQSRIPPFETPHHFSNWPSPSQQQLATEKSEVKIRQQGHRTTYETQTDELFSRYVFDQATGFIFENDKDEKLRGLRNTSLFFAPERLSNGLILPRLCITCKFTRGRLSQLKVNQIEKIKLFSSLPVDAFSISLPAKTHFLDSRHSPAGVQKTGLMRPVQSTIRAPVTDFAAYLQRHPARKPKPRN